MSYAVSLLQVHVRVSRGHGRTHISVVCMLCTFSLAPFCNYKKVKGRSHTVETLYCNYCYAHGSRGTYLVVCLSRTWGAASATACDRFRACAR